MVVHTLRIQNIHCASCEDTVRSIVLDQDSTARVTLQADGETVQVDSATDIELAPIIEQLHKKGFEVLDVDMSLGYTSTPGSTRIPQRSKSFVSKVRSLLGTGSPEERYRSHAEICLECGGDSESDVDTAVAPTAGSGNLLESVRAVFAIQGMTCASCGANISDAVREAVPNLLDLSVDAITGSLLVLLPSRREIELVEKAVDSAGYSSTLTEVLPVSPQMAKEYSLMASVSGMTCASCSAAVKHALEALPAVTTANVEVLDGRAEIITDSKVPTSELRDAVEEIGYGIQFSGDYKERHAAVKHTARTVTIAISGIHCEECPSNIMQSLKGYGEAVNVVDKVSVTSPYVKLTYLPSPPNLTIRSILKKLTKMNPGLGFEIVRPKSLEELSAENQLAEKNAIMCRLKLTTVFSVFTLITMVLPPGIMDRLGDRATWLMAAFATPVYFFAADIFHRKAIKEVRTVLRSSRPLKTRLLHFGSMNLLMSLGTSISYWASVFALFFLPEGTESYFDSVVFLTFFLLVGRFLDIYSKIKTTSAVSLVSKVRPDEVELYDATTKTTTTIPLDLIEVGELVSLFPGQRCAVDGVVQSGLSDLDEAMLTGESLPVPKGEGDSVFAGTLNSGRQTLIIKVTAIGQGTLLNDIVEAVRTGQMQRAPIERYVEEFTSVFVPVVVYLAILVWIVWAFFDGWLVGMSFAIATFVVACPCGIGLAAPTALYIGSGLAAKWGILARGGGEAFQEGSRLSVLCFDKTGTITVGGDLRITDTSGAEDDETVQLAARLEADSVHPLAKVVTEYAQGRRLTEARCSPVEHIDDKGRGMHAEVTGGKFNGKRVVIGNERVISEVGHTEPSKEQKLLLKKWKSEGKSVVLMAVDGDVVLMLAASDQIRRESRAVIHTLQKTLNIECWMISGDNPETAQAVAAQVGIPAERVIAGVLPQQKAERVKYLQTVGGASISQYGRAVVGMVGDGVNDAPALATSDVGIALGRGADIALSSSQFVLLREDLRGLPILIEISQAVMRRVKLNFFWAAIYNIIAIPVAAGVLYPINGVVLDPVWASLAMALSSVSVMVSSLMLRRFRPADL